MTSPQAVFFFSFSAHILKVGTVSLFTSEAAVDLASQLDSTTRLHPQTPPPLKQERRSASPTAASGSGACALPTRATADWAPGREPARAPSASRPSRRSAARSPATGRRSSEVRERVAAVPWQFFAK